MEEIKLNAAGLIVLPMPQLKTELEREHKKLFYPGQDKFYDYIKTKYDAPRELVREVVRESEINQKHQLPKKKVVSRVIVSKHKNQRWQIDLTEYKLGRNGYMICVVDTFSRFAWTKFIYSKEGHKVAAFLEQLFTHETPSILQSDQGTEFNNNDVKAVCERFGVKHVNSLTYSPQSNGYVERFNRTVKSILEKLKTANGEGQTRIATLRNVMKIYNEKYVHSITKKTPFEMQYGEVPQDEIDSIIARKEASALKIINGVGDDELDVGDSVRIALRARENRKLNKETFEKGYTRKWSNTTHIISRVNRKSMNGEPLPPTYSIEGQSGHFYRRDLLKIPPP